MAEGKKSFTFYCDWQETFKALPTDKAGELIIHILAYVNDENPETDDVLINAVFVNIKQQLKRDLKKWESKCQTNKLNGSKGGRPKKTQNNPTVILDNPTEPKKPDTDTDTDIYNKESFLIDWNKCRSHYLKTPSNLNRLYKNELDLFNSTDLKPEEIKKALHGLFKQQNITIDVMTFRPKHFLENVEKYYDAENEKMYTLYGTDKKEIQY